ncbi:MAG: DUF4386 domain-containing protein [Anaerolineae bacterium]|nr:DUF4386 domain-containing protein [Anaerolineae bacterium]
MNSNRKTARIVGVLFLTAMVTSLLGGGLLESILSAPDYLVSVSANRTQVLMGMFLELINGIAVVGIAAMMFPILRKHNESIALGYVGFRIIESVFCLVSAIIPLSLITLSQEYVQAGAPDASYFQTLGTLSVAERADLAGLLIPLFFSLGALLFYALLYQSKLIPRFLSVWGIIAAALVLTLNLLGTVGISIGMSLSLILALPIMLNEILLGIWLIVKGFNPSAIASGSAE